MLSEKQCKDIRKKLIDKGMGVTDLALALGINRVTVSALLNNLVSNKKHEATLLKWLREN